MATSFHQTELQVPGVPDDRSHQRFDCICSSKVASRAWAIQDSRQRSSPARNGKLMMHSPWCIGSHTIKLGGEMRWSQFNISQEAAPRGQFSFSGQYSGNILADFCWDCRVRQTFRQSLECTTGNMYQHCSCRTIGKSLTVSPSIWAFAMTISRRSSKPTTGKANFDYATGTLIQAGQNGASDAWSRLTKQTFHHASDLPGPRPPVQTRSFAEPTASSIAARKSVLPLHCNLHTTCHFSMSHFSSTTIGASCFHGFARISVS